MINAYVNGEMMELLAGVETKEALSDRKDVTIEFIDIAPLTAVISYEDDTAEISVYVRDELHTNKSIEMHGLSKNGIVEVDEGDDETVQIAFAVAEGINKYLVGKTILDQLNNVEDDSKGILFTQQDGKIISSVVEGKQRPALLCTTLFGAPRMVRPYGDEIADRFRIDSMSAEELEKAAEEGDDAAMEELAMAYLNGSDNFDEDPEKSFFWFEKSAQAGNSQSMFNAGLALAKGFGTERDFLKAAEWMEKAASAGDTDAVECAVDYKKLAEAWDKANSGDAQAQADLAAGLMKLGGSLEQAGEGRDYKESVMWAQKSVDQGNPDGCWTLALAYHHGRGVDEDMDKAIEFYQKGADLGSASCMHNLGCEYMSGKNINKDAHKGFELIKKAAENGNGLAMRDLGRCYQFANGTPGNMKKAVEWYEKALEIIDDPELEQKTMMFKMMANSDPSFAEDYPEDTGGEEYDSSKLLNDDVESVEKADNEQMDKYMTGMAPDAVTNAWKYEDELDMVGYLPNEIHGEAAWENLPRVNCKASEGDSKAIAILKELDDLNNSMQ